MPLLWPRLLQSVHLYSDTRSPGIRCKTGNTCKRSLLSSSMHTVTKFSSISDRSRYNFPVLKSENKISYNVTHMPELCTIEMVKNSFNSRRTSFVRVFSFARVRSLSFLGTCAIVSSIRNNFYDTRNPISCDKSPQRWGAENRLYSRGINTIINLRTR